MGNNTNASSANEGDEVTVTITPDEGWAVSEVTGTWYAAVAATRADINLLKDVSQHQLTSMENPQGSPRALRIILFKDFSLRIINY